MIIGKVETSGVKPNPRTGHAAINYKGKMLLILGGEGVSSKRASLLYNDLWAFDLRTSCWSELQIENKTVFRPRANFTANIYKKPRRHSGLPKNGIQGQKRKANFNQAEQWP